MKLQIIKPIVGIRDRGKPTESKITYADKGDRVSVVFDNTYESITQGMCGHYICVKDDQHFVVFHSQYDLVFNERNYGNGELSPLTTTENDLLYPKSTERVNTQDIEDTILE
jgi:hypothetical protein